MSNLLLLNRLDDNTFGKASLVKFCLSYFIKNRWMIKYINTDDWKKSIPRVKIVLFWFQQQVTPEKKMEKGNILVELIKFQKKYKIIIVDYIEDIHKSYRLFGVSAIFYKKYFSNKTKNYLLVRYENAVKTLYPNCNYYCLPFSVDDNILPEFNARPIKRILLTGRLKKKNYPVRDLVFDLKDILPIEILEHPSYKQLKHNFVGKCFLSKINKFIASVSTCGSYRFNYVVAKYFEIPASGALLFAYIEPIKDILSKYGFVDGHNMVAFTQDNIVEKIHYILDPKNKAEIDKIRLNGYNLIKKRHTHKTRFYKELDLFLKKLYSNKIFIICK